LASLKTAREGSAYCQQPWEGIVTLYPGWDSLDSVRTWHTVFEISGIAFLALLVGAEIFAFQYGHRKDELTAIAESNAETKRKSDADAAEARRKADVEALQKRLADADKKSPDFNPRTWGGALIQIRRLPWF
jgi:hypothetical protein